MNFFRMDEKRTNPICLATCTGRRFEIGDLPKVKLRQKLKKKARRDHKSCDKKTETRFKITSFLTEKHLVHGDSTISCLLSNLPPSRDGLSHVALVP